jgi:uncharacterized protein
MVLKQNALTIILAVGLIIALFILASGSSQTINVSPQDFRNTISVSGRSELTVDPDQAEIFVNIETLENTAKESKDENARVSENVRKALKKAGVKENNIETTQFRINPRYEYNRNTQKSDLTGYTVTHVLKITTLDLDKVGDYIDTAIDNGAARINSINFGLTDEKQIDMKGEAMIRASEEARGKAEALATNLEVRLGNVASVSESNFNYAPYVTRTVATAEAFDTGAPTEISPQSVTVSATVNVAFEIN